MLDIIRRRKITTRKEHKCSRCNETIERAAVAIEIVGKEDNLSKRLHLHTACHQLNIKENKYNAFRFK